jgi:hypothetical protein
METTTKSGRVSKQTDRFCDTQQQPGGLSAREALAAEEEEDRAMEGATKNIGAYVEQCEAEEEAQAQAHKKD